MAEGTWAAWLTGWFPYHLDSSVVADPPLDADETDARSACEPSILCAAEPDRPAHRRSEARAQLAPWQVKLAQDLLTARTDQEPPVTNAARRLGLSVTHFIKAFANTVGVAPYRWLLCQRLLYSIELLLDERHSLAQVAAESGFADQSHYTRAFKNLLGITPGRWRRALRSGVISQREALERVRRRLGQGG